MCASLLMRFFHVFLSALSKVFSNETDDKSIHDRCTEEGMVRGWEAVDTRISLVIFISGYFESGTNFPWYEEVQKMDEHKRFGNDSYHSFSCSTAELSVLKFEFAFSFLVFD